MPDRPNQDHGSSFPWLIYFFGSIGLFIFTIFSFFAISKLLSVATLILGVYLFSKIGFINLPFKRK